MILIPERYNYTAVLSVPIILKVNNNNNINVELQNFAAVK
jgi:hypothetical protein